jgi:hypothetical protein
MHGAQAIAKTVASHRLPDALFASPLVDRELGSLAAAMALRSQQLLSHSGPEVVLGTLTG